LEALERKDEALADFDQALALIISDGPRATSEGPIYPDIADVLDCRAKILLKMDDYDQALLDFDRAQNLRTRNADPNVLSLLYGFAATYTLIGLYQQALELLERAIAGDSKYRAMARREADFAGLRANPQYSRQFGRLLGSTDGSDTETPVRPVPGIGDFVRHTTFGEGVVIECLAVPGDHEVTVHFKGGVGIKHLLLSRAALEII